MKTKFFGSFSKSIVAIAAGVLCLTSLSCHADNTSLTGNVFGRAMWVWDAGVFNSPTKQAELLDFSALKKLDVLYISTGSVFQESELAAKNKNQVTPQALGAFLKLAHEKGLKVQALDGDPSHALTPYHERTLARLQRALDYNKTAPAAERVDGWQWDTEPYVLKDFRESTEKRQDIWKQYLDSAAQMRDAVKAALKQTPGHFALGYAVPFWADGAPENTVEWNGKTQAVTYHLMDILNDAPDSYVAIMAYRDKADGTNGSIAVSSGEADYASQHAPNVHVWIGQETLDVKGDPPSITFWQEGEGALNDAAAKIQEHYKGNAAIGGVAIHHWVSYKELSDRALLDAQGDKKEFAITAPQAGPTPRETVVTGTAPLGAGSTVTVGVKPDGDIWYDREPVVVGPDGSWSVPVRIGNEKTVVGKGFTIRATLKDAQNQIVAQKEVKVTRA